MRALDYGDTGDQFVSLVCYGAQQVTESGVVASCQITEATTYQVKNLAPSYRQWGVIEKSKESEKNCEGK